MVQITMVFAQLERARSSQRAVAWHAHRARRGDPYLGRVPFGYVRARDDDGRPVGPLEIDAETAPLVQQAAAVFLETRSMMAVQRLFDEHGYERAGVALRRGLASPQLAGIRVVDGVKIPGTWPAILEVATHDAIVAELNKPERGRGRPAGSRWLLSGFTVCGRCGQPMLAGGHRKVKAIGGTDRSQRYYRCARVRNHTTGCGATIAADAFEAWVEERLLDTVSPARWQQLRSDRTRQRIVDTDAVEADLAALARRLRRRRPPRGRVERGPSGLARPHRRSRRQTSDPHGRPARREGPARRLDTGEVDGAGQAARDRCRGRTGHRRRGRPRTGNRRKPTPRPCRHHLARRLH